jgi:hypothetical protein
VTESTSEVKSSDTLSRSDDVQEAPVLFPPYQSGPSWERVTEMVYEAMGEAESNEFMGALVEWIGERDAAIRADERARIENDREQMIAETIAEEAGPGTPTAQFVAAALATATELRASRSEGEASSRLADLIDDFAWFSPDDWERRTPREAQNGITQGVMKFIRDLRALMQPAPEAAPDAPCDLEERHAANT